MIWILLSAVVLNGQTPQIGPKPDIGILLCWSDNAEEALAHDQGLLGSVGQVLGLDGVAKTVGIHTEQCTQHMPDATCFGAPGGVMCRLSGIERLLRASAWVTRHYQTLHPVSYEAFWKADPEFVGHAFQYADGVERDPASDQLRQKAFNADLPSRSFFETLVEYNLAALLGHEVAHAHDDKCPITAKAVVEESGLFASIVKDDQSGAIFAKHSPSPDEVGADRCGMRHIRALTERLSTKPATQGTSSAEVLARTASDMVVFQMVFGWRKYEQLPPGKYGMFSLDSYLYSPYRAILFSTEIRASSAGPLICGSSAQMIVQSIQTTYKRYEGGGNVSDDLLSLFPKGVETSWNGKPWTAESFTCATR